MLGLASETDSALAIAPQTPHQRQIGLPVETDIALPMARQKQIVLGLASSAEEALPILPIFAYHVSTIDLTADTPTELPLYPLE